MNRKYLIILVLWLISGSTSLNAQDSLSVWKIEYQYLYKSSDTLIKQDAKFANIVTYGKATLYYTDSAYRLQYAADHWEIGDLTAPRRYSIYGNLAREGLSAAQQMPEVYELSNDDFPIILWANDYKMLKAEGNFEFMGMACNKLLFHPQKKLVDAVYEVYLSDNVPKSPWHPYTFMDQVPSGFLGLYKKNAANTLFEGIEAKEIKQINVPVDFFKVPPTMKIQRMIAPPKLNR
ncbi:hypothetical protein [Pedobacter sp. V48]|uniref:hypothetical protein n=1 Tax=Pedobacter sp. V48 TaxID=509635 RepID=UPI0003E4CBB9|nr:hypothetical protein [Pedobacter sp. V48]ETZ24096.1 hypothetical protein N824_16285 [Pedobacter sp. V48]